MVSRNDPVHNRLVAALPADVLAGLLPKLAPVALTMRQPVHNPEAPIEAVFFPESGMFSLVAVLEDGTHAEVGLIGREGVLGISLLSGIETPYIESMVQMPGTALRMGVRDFLHEMEATPPFRALILRYNEALQAQIMQTAACNGRHGLEQRFARWLLMARDRADADALPLTQEFMAMMLGVRRPSITVTAGILQRAGLIRYAGGRVTILDRASLEAASCECYDAVKRRFTTLLG
jgi:CRP-like cAMP-binding protein